MKNVSFFTPLLGNVLSEKEIHRTSCSLDRVWQNPYCRHRSLLLTRIKQHQCWGCEIVSLEAQV